MVRTIMIGALAAGALAMAGTAAAERGGSKGGKPAVAANAQSNAQAKPMRAKGRANSQGPANASARGIERSSANSVLKGSTVVAGPLTGLDPGDSIYAMVDGSLQEVGTVRRIVPGKNGRVSNVLVRTADGRVLPLAPGGIEFDSGANQWTALSMRPNDKQRRN